MANMDIIKQYDSLLNTAMLMNGYVSVPRLQAEQSIPYQTAREAVSYGIRRGWLQDGPEGFHYRFRGRTLSLRTLTVAECKETVSALSRDAFRVLSYLGQHTRATFEEILSEVDDDEEDMHDALTDLQQMNLVLCVCNIYCTNVAASAINGIKEHWESGKKSRRGSGLFDF